MRCHYLSDLHLESQDAGVKLPKGDVLIIAGDLCHARCLDPGRTDKYSNDQRGRVMRFIDQAKANFSHVLMVAGNHEHYDGVFEDTAAQLKRHLPGLTVLDNESTIIGGVRFLGTTLWSDFEGRCPVTMNGVRRRMGEYFFVKTRAPGSETLMKFQPEDALAAHDAAIRWLTEQAVSRERTVIISHHAPSLGGLNPKFTGNGLDGAYASGLDQFIRALENVPVWIHGHTHVCRTYHIGGTKISANCRGFEGKDNSARLFSPAAHFDV
ncbi:MAG: metallophosphoesterase [Hyphomicrobiaceae bacterium]